ncbi:Retrovirus-related Pol polyprotein from transposon 17.6 [Gossypium australe]|uniref:Retrovirus-related Pol polyprotein from transposon 17.6 n=1 Tax=Gossypium australe TaxID=47621 RepID=A0A5B6VQA1_9ROSI|nr:Retrovirus-related Pol polyprotein from transposon 17.6 [Gossypium australe]
MLTREEFRIFRFYAYLGDNNTLTDKKLLKVLKKYRKALGWTIADIKGINLAICMHKILLEDCNGNSIEQQRRLNPIMKQVTKKEIIRWLDAGIIYPISNSLWVNRVQYVPKKGGVTIVSNDNNEIIPTHTVTG